MTQWTKADKKYLAKHTATQTVEQIAAALGKSAKEVRQQLAPVRIHKRDDLRRRTREM